ncbi:MAG TPA: metallophosphoesterase [Acidimicrobiales bacterium]|nr:metallophosphoesterase [Acidimicrobiales bacterium]
MSFPPRSWGRPRAELFAVEATAVQITWAGLRRGPVRVRVADREVLATSDGFPGAVVVDGLSPDTPFTALVEGPGLGRTGARLTGTTLALPPGPERFRFATVSDVHLGATRFGLSKRMRERGEPAVPHPLRCGRAAIAEARHWGAALLVVKGDLVDQGHPEEWAHADELLGSAGIPVEMVPGNHEVKPGRTMEIPAVVGGGVVEVVRGVRVLDVPGLRLVLVDSTIDRHGHGRVRHTADEVVAAAADADGPVLVALHHHPQRFAFPWFWPPGTPGREAARFLRALGAANPDVVVTSGHTHRNRRHRWHGVTITEVCATKDFPGAWAGYVVHDGGITQTVRRIAAPDAIAWTEYTRRAVLGVWGRWSPGRLRDRCFTQPWTR